MVTGVCPNKTRGPPQRKGEVGPVLVWRWLIIYDAGPKLEENMTQRPAPVNTKHVYNIYKTLAQRHGRWSNIE